MTKNSVIFRYHLLFQLFPRSGTNFLRDLLNSTQLVSSREFTGILGRTVLNDLKDEAGSSVVLPLFRRCYEELKSRSERWGVFLHADQVFVLDRLFSAGVDPHEMKWIWLTRRDKIAQALSYIRARETKVFYVAKDKPLRKEANDVKVSVSVSDLHRYAIRAFFSDQMWETFFNMYGLTPYKVYYEDFIDKSVWDTTIAGILDFLSVPYELPLNICESSLKQAQEEKPQAYKEIVGFLAHKSFQKYLPFDYDW